MDDKLFVNATNLLNEIGENDDQIHMIHAYQLPEFEPLFSFGDSYKSAHPMVIDRLTTGAISCDKETSTVMFGFMTSPMLHGYAAEDGQLKWKTRVDNLNFVEIFMIEQDGRPGLRYSYENRGNLRDSMLRPVSLGDGQAVFQIQRMQVTEEDVMEMDPEISIISLILNVENGEAEVMSEELPIILGATGTFVSTIANNRVHVTMWHH